MKILYLSGSYVPSRRASSVHVMQMCQAMAQHGHQVNLITKNNAKSIESDVRDDYAFYGVDPLFSIQKLPRPAFRGGGILYSAALWYILRQSRQELDLVYSRDISGAWISVRLGLPTVFEAHVVPTGSLHCRQYQQIVSAPTFCRLVVISEGLKSDLKVAQLLPNENKSVVAHDGATISSERSFKEPSVELGGNFALGYVGQLYAGKGMEIILPLARQMPDVCFHIVGGMRKDLAYWQAQKPPPNLKFHGFISHSQLKTLYQQFDVLMLPPQTEVYGATGQLDISRWMSPMKMFEYMAAGKPIISSDLPVLKEVLVHERNALLVPPNDVNAWVFAVRRLQSDSALATRLGNRAREDLVQNYTWWSRAEKVLRDLTL